MKRRSVLVLLLLTLVLTLALAGTALAGKTPVTISDAQVTYVGPDGIGNENYDLSLSFTGKPYKWTYAEYTPLSTFESSYQIIARQDLKDGTATSTFSFCPTEGVLQSITFYLYDRKGNVITYMTVHSWEFN